MPAAIAAVPATVPRHAGPGPWPGLAQLHRRRDAGAVAGRWWRGSRCVREVERAAGAGRSIRRPASGARLCGAGAGPVFPGASSAPALPGLKYEMIVSK